MACALQFACDKLKNDRAVVLAAVKQKGWALRFAHNKLKNDRAVVLAAVKQNGEALQYASDALKNDRALVLAAVRQNGLALNLVHDSLKEDKTVVLTAVRQNGLALWLAHNNLKKDKAVVFAAVRQDARSFGCVDPSLKDDKELAFIALMNNPDCLLRIPASLRRARGRVALLAYLRAELIKSLPERYKVAAERLLNNYAYLPREIPFVLEDQSLADVFKMEWEKRIHTHADIEAYCNNLSKLLATKVILQVCKGDIHSEWFAHFCTQQEIGCLATRIHAGLKGLNIESLMSIHCNIEKVVEEYVASNALSLSSLGRAAYSSFSSFVGNMVERMVGTFTYTPAATRRHTELSAVWNGGVGLLGDFLCFKKG